MTERITLAGMKQAGGERPMIAERALEDRAEGVHVPPLARPVLGAKILGAKKRQWQGAVRVDDRDDLPRPAHVVRPERDDFRVRHWPPAEGRPETRPVHLVKHVGE